MRHYLIIIALAGLLAVSDNGFAEAGSQPLPTITVGGAVYASRDTTIAPPHHFGAVFRRRLPSGTQEQVVARQMPATGRYRVQLVAGQTYIVTLSYGHCEVEQQEFTVPAGSGIVCKNFYLDYTDTVSFSHQNCLRKLRHRK